MNTHKLYKSRIILFIILAVPIMFIGYINADNVYATESITYGTTTFYYEVSGDTATIISCDIYAPTTSIVVPSEINGYKVTAINDYAFSRELLEQIVISSPVTRIGKGAFYQAFELQKVVLPDSLEYIGELAFYDCPKLQNIKVQSGAPKTKTNAFIGYTNEISYPFRKWSESEKKQWCSTAKWTCYNSACIIDATINMKWSYEYDGTAKCPKPEITYNDEILKEGIDYTVSYSNNTQVGTATMKIFGINEFNGMITKHFSIHNKGESTTKVVVDENKQLTMYYDDLEHENEGIAIYSSINDVNDRDQIKSIVIDSSFINYKPKTTADWFYDFCGCVSISGLENIDTSQVTNMSGMFGGCLSIVTGLDLSSFDTSQVTDMNNMFKGCAHMKWLDLSSFDTAKVTNMNSMFKYCSSLAELDLSGFNTVNVENMADMFLECKFKRLDLSGFDTSKVTDMSNMFSGATRLEAIYVDEDWDTSSVTVCKDMFYRCLLIKGGVGTVYNADNTGVEYARIDDAHNPGYFTLKSSSIIRVNNNFPTCKAEGNKTYFKDTTSGKYYSDSYGEKEIEENSWIIPKTAHLFAEWQIIKSPSCEDKGSKQRTCTVCGFTDTEDIDEKGHDWEDMFTVDQGASCNADGSKSIHCKNCEAVKESTVIPALGHNLIHHDAKSPTETEVGWDAYDTCSRCDYTTYVEIPPLGHTHTIVHHDAKSPTCEEVGWKAYNTCNRCEYTTYNEIPALGHNYKHYKNPAGLMKNGSEYDQCANCNQITNKKTLYGYSTSYVKSFKVSKGKKSFTAKWKKQSKKNQKKFNGYQIRYSLKSDMSGAKTTTASKSSKSKKIKKLQAKKKYYVQVRTYTKANGNTFYSNWSSKKSVTTKK